MNSLNVTLQVAFFGKDLVAFSTLDLFVDAKVEVDLLDVSHHCVLFAKGLGAVGASFVILSQVDAHDDICLLVKGPVFCY